MYVRCDRPSSVSPTSHTTPLSTSSIPSTLVNFTLRFYDPEQGAVLLDGHDLRTMNVHNLRQHVAYVGVRLRGKS